MFLSLSFSLLSRLSKNKFKKKLASKAILSGIFHAYPFYSGHFISENLCARVSPQCARRMLCTSAPPDGPHSLEQLHPIPSCQHSTISPLFVDMHGVSPEFFPSYRKTAPKPVFLPVASSTWNRCQVKGHVHLGFYSYLPTAFQRHPQPDFRIFTH